MPESPLLSIRDLSVAFRQRSGLRQVLSGVSLDIRPGEILALAGESGSGKSVTSLAVMRLLPPQTTQILGGQILFDGHDLLSLPEAQMRGFRGKRLAMIFQEPMTALNPVLTVRQQLAEVLHCHLNLQGAELERRCLELLDEVGIPEPRQRLAEYPHQLSGGMRQRVLIAIALACQPSLLLADEPTTALDVSVQAQIMSLLDTLRKRHGTAILFVTHDLALAAQYADRYAVMYAGTIVESAPVQELLAHPAHPYTSLLLRSIPSQTARGKALQTIPGQVPQPENLPPGCRFSNRCPLADEHCRHQAPPTTLLSPQHSVCCFHQQAPLPLTGQTANSLRNASAPAVLTVRGLKVHFPVKSGIFSRTKAWVRAVDGLDLTLRQGETLALVGESGCGKSTVAKALVRLVTPTAGEIILSDGQNIANLPSRALKPYRHQLQMIFQDPFSSLDPRMMLEESLLEAIPKPPRDAERRRQLLTDLLATVGLDGSALTRYPHQFSGGQRQRLGLVRALAANPRIILCDECTSALDVSIQAQILNLLKQLQRERGLAYLFITHDLSVVKFLADRVAVMYLGIILEEGTCEEIFAAPAHPYTQALLAAAPDFSSSGDAKIHLQGDVPSPVAPPPGCPFHPRCPFATDDCRQQRPDFRNISETHRHRCLKDSLR